MKVDRNPLCNYIGIHAQNITASRLLKEKYTLSNSCMNWKDRKGKGVLAKGAFVRNNRRKEALSTNFLDNPSGRAFARRCLGI